MGVPLRELAEWEEVGALPSKVQVKCGDSAAGCRSMPLSARRVVLPSFRPESVCVVVVLNQVCAAPDTDPLWIERICLYNGHIRHNGLLPWQARPLDPGSWTRQTSPSKP